MLSFTPDQIKSISQDVINMPAKIASKIDGKAKYQLTVDKAQKVDEGQTVFSDAWKNSVAAYHGELKELNSVQKTNYDYASLEEAAHMTRGNTGHFPVTPPWYAIQPKVLDSNKGLPSTNLTPNGEPQKIAPIAPYFSLLTTGFEVLPLIDDSDILSGTNLKVTDSSDFMVGQKLFIYSGSAAMFVTITALNTTPDHSVDFSIDLGAVPNGSVNYQNFFPGFTNTQRQGQSPLGTYAGAYPIIKAAIQSKVIIWEGSIDAQIGFLTANNDLINTANVAAALANVQSAKTAIDTWQALPDLAVNGLLSNAGIAILTTALNNRTTQIPLRITQIGTDLGSVSQNPDGTTTGSGAYFELMKLVTMRGSIGIGTLTAYYTGLKNLDFFDLEIQQAYDQQAQYATVMAVSKILADTTIGQDTFAVDSVAGLSLGNTVKVFDADSIIYERSILQITGTQVKLDSGIPISLLASKLARIVKML